MCRLRRVLFALAASVFVTSAAVGLLAVGRGGAVPQASQADVAALTTEIQKQDAAFFGAFHAHVAGDEVLQPVAVHIHRRDGHGMWPRRPALCR